ncbi:MAG: pyrroline-5-carboxylate reductase [Oscillospiraceae bacterium]|nr:pyrroline-5-carboxylate reductase [Oscillospiraceae bacterium]
MKNTLGVIGLGNMAGALLSGLKNSSIINDAELFGYDIQAENASSSAFVTLLDSEREVAQRCKYVLLAVKPQNVGEVLFKITPVLTDESVIISICAGISIDFIRAKTSTRQKTVQVMPNTPMMYGEGASTIAFTDNLNTGERDFARGVIDSCGISRELPADKMNESICINGSSPAFIFAFAKCFVDYARSQSIDEDVALDLFAQTLKGAAVMLSEKIMTADELIAQVSSPGGTTVAGLAALQQHGFSDAVKAACEACTKRAYELGEIFPILERRENVYQ